MEIANLSGYNDSMKKSLIDKIFFMDKVEAELFVDFGCADGTVLAFLKRIFPSFRYLGYDNNPKMLATAREDHPDIEFTDDWAYVEKVAEEYKGRSCLFALSVVHEVYSYGLAQVDDFWHKILHNNFTYIVMRDMCVSKTASRPSDPITAARIRQLFDASKMDQWESIWGTIDENWSMIHFLLTYRYQDNWDREVRENYLPINKETLLGKFTREYRPVFIEHYTLPFLRQRVWDDFGVQLQERTHLKLIMRKE